jgi:hypothetical protein
MTTMIRTARPQVKATRKTGRPDHPFGAGLLRFVPFAVTAPGFVEPSDSDRAAVGLMFADDDEPTPDYDLLAGEAAAIDAMGDMTPLICLACNQPAEWLTRDGWCDACDDMITRHVERY